MFEDRCDGNATWSCSARSEELRRRPGAFVGNDRSVVEVAVGTRSEGDDNCSLRVSHDVVRGLPQ